MPAPLYVAFKAESPSSSAEDAKHLVRYFCQECGFRPLPWMQRKFSELLHSGYSVPDLESIIDTTAMAPRPSWAYLSAIIRNNAQMVDEYFRKHPLATPLYDEHHHQEQE